MSFGVSALSIIENAMVSADIMQNDILTDVQHQGTVQCMNYQQSSFQPTALTDFNHESFRHLSLLSWINKHVSKEKLARFGFYYNLESDYVKCYFCEVVIGEWGVGDDPLTEHHKHSPDCDFINLKHTDNIPIGDEIHLKNELKAIQESLKTGRRNTTKLNPDMVPRHPDYRDELTRLQSYVNWPKFMRQTPKDLSVAGFFYLGVGDEVKCFFCGGCLKDWEETDTPIQEHKRHFYDQCHFIKKNYQELKRKYSKQYSKNLVKATPTQIGELTNYMNDNLDLKEGKINLGSNKSAYNEMWEKLSDHLNSFDGPRKNTKAWKEVWRNHKYNSKRKSSTTSSPKSERADQEVSQKKCKIYHNFEEYQNYSTVEPDTTNPRLEDYYNNAEGLTSNSMITEYQTNLDTSSHIINNSRPLMGNKSLELELNKQKCENERLQFELHKLRFELEKRELQQQIEWAKHELEKSRLQSDTEIPYLQLL